MSSPTNELAKHLIDTYFKTQTYPFTRHHIDSFDQFMSTDLPNMLRSANPILILKNYMERDDNYQYKVEVFVGGEDGKGIYIGTPSIALQDGKEVRLLFPNEARLRNLTYSAEVKADIFIRITVLLKNAEGVYEPKVEEIRLTATPESDDRILLLRMPIMLHSRYCVLHNKPAEFLREAGECEYDYGGYFVVEGGEKILITRQEQAFNTLYITEQVHDPKVKFYCSMNCISPLTRQVKMVTFYYHRREETLHIGLPYTRKSVPVFIVFRALGIQSDKDILKLIFPDPDSDESKMLAEKLIPSILEAQPFLDTFSAVNYIRILTKGFGVEHVLDILRNQLFIHVENLPGARASYLGLCVRKILRVVQGIDETTNRDDIRNQRCLTSGFLTQLMFQGVYKAWAKAVALAIDSEYNYNKSFYRDEQFFRIFDPGNRTRLFKVGMMTEGVMRAFKGKWGSGMGEEKSGVLQVLSRLSYHDFMSHTRRAVRDFDTTMKLPGPRRLHPSQYGYFCTSETPTGASIGITKNLSIMTSISTATDPEPIIKWLFDRGGVLPCEVMTAALRAKSVPLFINGGLLGYTLKPKELTMVLKYMKWTGCLPVSASVSFSIRDRIVYVYLDEGRPLRPLVHLEADRTQTYAKLEKFTTWRDMLMGEYHATREKPIHSTQFLDPFADKEGVVPLQAYIDLLQPVSGPIEMVDPYEHNETYIANFREQVGAETSHIELHPSTILGLMTSMIPFPQHNQSPRNQLSCSQSKQGLSVYSTQFPNRFDNQAHVLCYGEAPLTRTLYYDYVADGNIGYGHNLVLAIGSFTGYNQDDGIVMNQDTIMRGAFRNMSYRSYEGYEEDDPESKTKTRIANPASVAGWVNLKPGIDYSHLDERGIIKEGVYVDQNTAIIGRYIQTESGIMNDASVTPQVWTKGRVEKIVVTVNNKGLRLVKIRVVQDRIPELGDKFSNRHGQKGTIGMFVRAQDMPRTKEGLVPDMLMNPHAIPSRMTIAQLLETLFGKYGAAAGAIANGTSFMSSGDPSEQIGAMLQDQFGMEKYGNEIMYDGTSGVQVPSQVFIGFCYTMRLKHMTEDKWNARAEGRREQRTHQPTGGRGNEGGLRNGDMELNALLTHGIASFTQETYTKRSDGTEMIVCNGCGTIPIYNEREKIRVCPLCDGPVRFAGTTAKNLELLPPNKRTLTTFSKVQIPYVVKLLDQELSTYMNIGMRLLTAKDVTRLRQPPIETLKDEEGEAAAARPLPERVQAEQYLPEIRNALEKTEDLEVEDLEEMGRLVQEQMRAREEETGQPVQATVTVVSEPEGNAVATADADAVGVDADEELPALEADTAAPVAPAPVPPATNFAPMNVMMMPPTAMVPMQMMAAPPQVQQVQMMAAPPQPQQVQMMPVTQMIPMAQPALAPPTQMMAPVVPGAAPTLVVDTSEGAMAAQGLPSVAPSGASFQRQGAAPGATRRRVRFTTTPAPGVPAPNTNARQIGPPGSPPPAANTRVTVNKMG